MNVRFFAGTRAIYDSLPTPRNPLGLYFCEDTKELFWADMLLTDGMRVVPTMADLPTADKAADGIVYYVTETRNGYVVPHGTTEWLQTIYAPALDISKVPEDELYNTVTTVGAVRDIEVKLYGYIDERIANIEIGTNESGVKAIYFAGKNLDSHDDGTFCIDRLCALRALGFVVPDDLSDNDKLNFVTKEYMDEQLAAITGVNLSEYAKKTDLEGLATEEFVLQEIAKIDSNVNVDTTNLVTKDELTEAINNIEHPAVDLSGLATETFVQEQIAAIPEINLSDYAKKSEIEGLASEAFVSSEIAKIEIPDVSEYMTESELDEKGFITEHQSLEGYATEAYVEELLEGIEIPETDLSEYSKTEEMNSAINAATIVKANNIPFTTNKVVSNAIGLFQTGDDLKGCTVAEILAKLLGLTDIPNEEPEIPDEPQGIIETIVYTKLPMYSITEDGNLAEIPFKLIKLTESEDKQIPTESGFYQIVDDSGIVIESGYQEIQAVGDVPYIIALPKELDYMDDNVITYKVFDTNANTWSASTEKANMISDPEEIAAILEGLYEDTGIFVDTSHIDTDIYTIWLTEECPTGSILRYMINE
jgi:hypothetical protein